jgi:hypothetical protein
MSASSANSTTAFSRVRRFDLLNIVALIGLLYFAQDFWGAAGVLRRS